MIKITIQIDDAKPFEVLEVASAVVSDVEGGTIILLPLGTTTTLREGNKLVSLFRLPAIEDKMETVRKMVTGATSEN